MSFALHLEIPHFALRAHKELRIDRRKRRDGTPLRHSQRLPFMRSPSGQPYCLYESQTSISVTGVDRCVWSAVALVDAYHDAKRSSRHHHRQSRLGVRFDPLGANYIVMEYPDWEPREYFLRVSAIQLDQSTTEWHFVIRKFRDAVHRWVNIVKGVLEESRV